MFKIYKKQYVAPSILIEKIQIEGTLAIGSARVLPTDGSGLIKEEWETDADRDENLSW